MGITRVTTPTNTFKLPENVSDYAKVEITYEQGGLQIIKLYTGSPVSWASIDGKDISVTLTQEETKQFNNGKASVQVRAKTAGGKVKASAQWLVDILDTESENIL